MLRLPVLFLWLKLSHGLLGMRIYTCVLNIVGAIDIFLVRVVEIQCVVYIVLHKIGIHLISNNIFTLCKKEDGKWSIEIFSVQE